MMFTEHAFLNSYGAAEAGFAAVEFLFPSASPRGDRRTARAQSSDAGSVQPAARAVGMKASGGLAALPARFDELRSSLARALDYVAATEVKRVHMIVWQRLTQGRAS